MRILVDENIPRMTVQALIDLGHEVRDVRGTPDQAVPDEELWRIAQREQRLLITTDKGFATRRHRDHAGILIVRLRRPSRTKIHARVLQGLQRIEAEEWPNTMVIMRDRVVSVWRG